MRLWIFGLLALSAACLPGYSTTVNMYPVEGPLASVRPLPVIVANVDGINLMERTST